MNSQNTVRLGWSVMIGVITPLIVPNLAEGANLRTPMIKEGYLSFRHSGPTFNGEERTGWTDVRHPALDGTVDNVRGYDWSDNLVRVLTHNVNAPGGNSNVNPDLRRQDFDVANAIYAQAGITILQENNITIPGNDIVTSMIMPPGSPVGGSTVEPSLSMLFGKNRSANTDTVNQYYVDDIPVAEGYTLPPIYASRGGFAFGGNNTNPLPPGTPNFNNGFAIADTSRSLPNGGSSTFAHELGHFLMDDNRFTSGDPFHSRLADDLMNANPDDPNPTAYKIQAEMFGLREPGQRIGNIGTKSHFGENVTNLAGGAAITQIEALHRSPFVKRDDNGFTHGDRADFDWVEDNIPLELATQTGDNHSGIDFLTWEIANIAPSQHLWEHPSASTLNIEHQHDNWLTGDRPELTLGRFNGNTFQIVDVISQIARYADMDVGASGNWSPRESALDYIIEFSSDSINWVRGTLNSVFEDGWTLASKAEDYVARWFSDVQAKFVRIAAQPLGGNHDGNTQIDAIIAGTAKDFGDAPDSYKTLLASDGPRYDEGNLQRLGSQWDSEIDGQPTILADGDDKSILGGFPTPVDDEDGVVFGDSWVDVTFNISRPDPNPYQLRAWWDTNYNGVFDHTSELYIDDLLTLAPGIFTKRYNLGFNPKADGLYSRFRLTWDPLDLDVKPFGEYYSKADCNTTDAAAGNCVSHGEVEDYVHVPEPSSIFGLLAFTGLGLMGLRKKR
ncbi:hypothetical protein B5D77_21285 [Microcystis sp. MC19]|uniref:PEP-CTERM sorting domain-containing protein n=1 Tax=Microcystis sp. MC19 TaxID=1967666 RepID=UPI000D1306B4|nr:PEP-CTERM sorting domain-containing protein [Microcystis sp. MC19]AVQ73505.1 hypothetical protein B5D77_21285 [Microcystis sp. MC19]